MCLRSPKYAPLFLISAFLITSACSDRNDTSPTAPSVMESFGLTAEPLTIAPELLSAPFCGSWPPFRAPVTVIVRGRRDLIVRRLGFDFTDRFGRRSVPATIRPLSGSSGATAIPNSSPVPFPSPATLPSSSPIPIPGSSPFDGLRLSGAASHRLPFSLEFGCGVPAAGTLSVSIEATDERGASGTSQVNVRIGS